MIEKINIIPHTSLLPKLGKSGYSTAQAIAELVDNSIDAISDSGQVTITINKQFIKVSDTGTGMNKTELTDCLRLAKSNKTNQLGRFGLGLKTASLSLGSCFTITTKSKSEDNIYKVVFDEKEWGKNHEWKIKIDVQEAKILPPFTEIIINSLKNKITLNTIDKIKIDIGQRYAPYLANGEISIYVNKDRCLPIEPDLLENTKREINIPVKFNNSNIGQITGWVALLKEGSNKGNYGFTTYWLDRMITTYDKIAIGEHPTISRIIGEIHMDYLEPTHNKREFIKETPLYELTVKLLKDDLKNILSEARKKSTVDTITPRIKENIQKYSEATLEILNTDDYFRELTIKNVANSFQRDDSGIDHNKVWVEKRGKNNIDNETSSEKNPFSNNREATETHKSLRKGIKIKGKYFNFIHEFKNLGRNESMRIGNKNLETHTIEIFTNIDFPAYQVSKDKAFYGFLNIADFIAELYCSEVQGSIYTETREAILRKVSEYIEELGK